MKVHCMSASSLPTPPPSSHSSTVNPTHNHTRKTLAGCWVLFGVALCTFLLFYSIFWGLMSQPKGSQGHQLNRIKPTKQIPQLQPDSSSPPPSLSPTHPSKKTITPTHHAQ